MRALPAGLNLWVHSTLYCIAIATFAIAARSWNSASLMSTSTRLIVPVNANGDSYWSETGDTSVAADIEGLVDGEAKRHLLLEAALADHLLAHPQRDRAARAELAFLVDLDLGRQHSCARRDRFGRGDR